MSTLPRPGQPGILGASGALPPLPPLPPSPSAGALPPGAAQLLAARTAQQRQTVRGGRFARWHQEPSVPQEEETWLLTYLDVVTLLLVMMVVMLSMSEPITGKPPLPPSQESGPVALQASVPEPVVAPQVQADDPLGDLPLDQLGAGVEVVRGEGTVSFRISSELLFPSGDAGLSPQGLQVLDSLLPALNAAQQHRVVVEGHTDNVPIHTPRFPSNWELAAGRAGSVVRHLQSQGIDPARLRATGLADAHPLASNATPEGRAANRRVELVLESAIRPGQAVVPPPVPSAAPAPAP